ncbi:spore germination protein [Rossellomorea vietnamensis]|uniref:Spore germination protein n=1 Tax=Rossellomorea vietnamensis TaxID=218284 RepID=A0A6I6UG06_9BACI|nr:spore germination protein [Rossellomorea vietnamensis]QHE61825.1 spore germination protein [Rossellomorea vietnamensis]
MILTEGANMSSFYKKNRRKPKQLLSEKEEVIFEPLTLDEKVSYFQEGLFHTDDLKIRNVTFNAKRMTILFLDSVIDNRSLQTYIIQPLLEKEAGTIQDTVSSNSVNETLQLEEALSVMVDGHCIILQEGSEWITFISMPKIPSNRNEPINEKVIRGSHQGFSENISENIHLIRERISSPKLTVKYSSVGETTRTKYSLVYLSDLTDMDIVKTIEERISYIDSDSIQSPGYFEEFLEDNSFSPFPQFLNTERPDRVAGNLMEGRVALVMEGSPTVLIFPVNFFSFFQTSEDYNNRAFIGSFIRFIRLISFIATLCLPAFYIAVISYNYEIIPVEIIFSIKSSLEYVPFPPLIEAAIMQLTLELLREAAIRLPNPIAQTIGVVGGLVIGTAVVEANLVSNTMVIVVAITAISSFVIPSNELSTSVRVLGFPLMIAAALFGVLGIVIGLMLLLIHMFNLKSMGHHYLYPVAPLDIKGLKDTFIRLPVWLMKKRPKDLKTVYRWKTSDSRGWEKNEDTD